MFKLNGDLKVYMHWAPIDFRAGINSLRATATPLMPKQFPEARRSEAGRA